MSQVQRFRLVKDTPSTSRIARMLTSIRGLWYGPFGTQSSDLAHLYASPQTATGMAVSEVTALNQSAVWAAVNLISSDVAGLPLVHYRRLKGGGKERYSDSRLYHLLHDKPNDEMTSIVWRKTIQAHALTWGNGYSEIVRDQAGKVSEIWPLTPDRVTPFRRGYETPLQYRVANPGGTETIFNNADILHVPGLGWDGTMGYSVIAKARESIALSGAAERFGATFFGNGATFGGILSYPGPRPPEVADKNYRESLNAQHQGVDRAHKFLALYNGAKYEKLGIPPDDAQFLETRRFQVTEIARWFNLPPHKVGDLERATYTNIEQQDLEYYKTTLVQWLEIWEQELCAKLIPSLEINTQLIEHVVEGFLRGDAAGRGTFYASQFNVGAVTPNEIREAENRNPISGGDRAFVQLGMMPLDKLDAYWDAEIEAKKPKPPPVAAPPTQDQVNSFIAALEARLAERDGRLMTETEARSALAVKLETAEREINGLRGELSETHELLTAATQTLEQARVEHVRLTAEKTHVEADCAAAFALATDAQEQAKTAARTALEALSARDVALADRDALLTRADTAEGRVADTDSAYEVLRGEYDGVAAELETARTHVLQLEPLVAELRDQVKTYADVRETLSATEAKLADGETARKAVEVERDAHIAEIMDLQDRVIHAQSAVRGVLIDAVQRMLDREAGRARHAYGTPEKFAKWLGSFYQVHGDVCRLALRPALRACLAVQGDVTTLDATLDAYVAAHLEQSIRQLTTAADEQDAETLAGSVERVLRRWETERADAVADTLLKGL